jgi:hypothetical protein
VTQAGAAPTLAVSPASFSDVPASGRTLTITVTSNSEWTASSDFDWCSLSSISGTNNAPIRVTVAANATPTPRNATITFTAGALTQTVTVAQLGIVLPPNAPTNVLAETQTATSIRVSWTAVPGATGYKIYYTTAAILDKRLAGTVNSGTITTYTHTGLTTNTVYTYYVTAQNSAGESDYSEPATASTSDVPGISLSETGTYTFPDASLGYGEQTPKTVTINNTSTVVETGALTLTLSGADATSFTLSKTEIRTPGIIANGSDDFTVAPNTGLPARTYTASIMVSGTDIAPKSFTVKFTVTPFTYGIRLDVTEPYTFPDAIEGYTTLPDAKTVIISNAGNQPTGDLSVALSGTNSGSFTLSRPTVSSIAAAGTDTFKVVPETDLLKGDYTATVTVSGGSNITAQRFDVRFKVITSGTVDEPTASPDGGAVDYDTRITLTGIPGATIYYTTTGINPTVNPSYTYTAPFTLASLPATVKAIAAKTGMDNSPIMVKTFTLMDAVAQPVADPATGAISSDRTITLTSATVGATIRYTTNGTVPTATTGTVYSAPFTLPSLPATLKAIAIKSGMRNSTLMSQDYTRAHTPVTNITNVPNGGTAGVAIDLSSATVEPADATNRTIVWSIKTPGGGVTSLSGTGFTPTADGRITLTATIANGKAVGTPYTQDFTIQCNATLASSLAWIRENAQADTNYSIILFNNESSNPVTLDKAAVNDKKGVTITLSGQNGSETTVSLTARGSLFTVGADVKLELGDIILKGRNHLRDNPRDNPEGVFGLVHVQQSGTLVMKDGAKITGNHCTTGGGVYVAGTLFMEEGCTISNNTASYYGGGVYITGGYLHMYGGTISGNTAKKGGGVGSGGGEGNFWLSGGSIRANTATEHGGGLYHDLSRNMGFFMFGGAISGNSAPGANNDNGIDKKSGGKNLYREYNRRASYEGDYGTNDILFSNTSFSSGYNYRYHTDRDLPVLDADGKGVTTD